MLDSTTDTVTQEWINTTTKTNNMSKVIMSKIVTGEMLADTELLSILVKYPLYEAKVTATLNPLKEGKTVYTRTLNIEEL